MAKFTLTIEDNDGKEATRTVEITSQEWPLIELWAAKCFPDCQTEVDPNDPEKIVTLPTRWHVINIIQKWVEGGWSLMARQLAEGQAQSAVQAAIEAARARKVQTDTGEKT